MKRNVVVLFTFFSYFGGVYAQEYSEEEFLGKWKCLKILAGKIISVEEAYETDQVYYIFKEDYTYEEIIGNQKNKGLWSFNPKRDRINMKITEGKGKNKKYKVIILTESELILAKSSTGQIFFEKIDQEQFLMY